MAMMNEMESAPAEFLLLKSQYQAETGRAVERGALFFQIRQAFPPGEVTPEEANKIGYETAMRWTKGKYQFFVCTHIDKGHIHNHIYYNSTAQDCSRKFHNFIGSSFAVRRPDSSMSRRNAGKSAGFCSRATTIPSRTRCWAEGGFSPIHCP